MSEIELVDTHCHIQSIGDDGGERITREMWYKSGLTADGVVANAIESGVTRMICVGCDLADSQLAIDFVQKRENCWASIGIHPHEAAETLSHGRTLPTFAALLKSESQISHLSGALGDDEKRTEPYEKYREGAAQSATPRSAKSIGRVSGSDAKQAGAVRKIVAIGECGLDYYYEHSPKADQIKVLRFQLELASETGLPVIFHVREAFDDFWPIFDDYKDIKGVLHSFTDNAENLKKALSRGLYIGVNGIVTFARDPEQMDVYKSIPLDKLLLETDAPFLTPTPFRGKINEPKQAETVGRFLAELRDVNYKVLASATTQNARKLFGI